MKTTIQDKRNKLSESQLKVGELYTYIYTGADATIICLITEKREAVVLHVESSFGSCRDKPGDIWPLNGEGDGGWTYFDSSLTLSNN